MTDTSSGQFQLNSQFLLRAFVLLAAVVGTIFYAGIWAWVWSIPNKQRDGFELIAPFLGTFYFLLLVVPCWYFGIKNYALKLAAVFAVFALFFPTDQYWHWFPWHLFGGN